LSSPSTTNEPSISCVNCKSTHTYLIADRGKRSHKWYTSPYEQGAFLCGKCYAALRRNKKLPTKDERSAARQKQISSRVCSNPNCNATTTIEQITKDGKRYQLWHQNPDNKNTWLCAKCYAFRTYKRKFANRTDAYRHMSQRMTGSANPFFGKQHTEITKKQISDKKKGVPLPEHARLKMIGRIISTEARIKLSAKSKGRPSPMRGKHHTDESKMKISIANLGRYPSEETRRKLSEAMKGERHPCYGKHRSDETKAKISKALKGQNSPFFGRMLTEEAKRILSEKNKGKPAWNKGMRMSNEARRNMSIAHLGIRPSEEIRKRMSAAQIGLKRKPVSEIGRLNMSRSQIGRKHSDETRAMMRTCTLNEAVFDIITEESAYWAGFLFADGNISYKNGMAVIALHVKETDLLHLEKFRVFVGSSHKVGMYVNKKWGNTSYSLSLRSEKMANKLAEYGIVQRKCFTANIKRFENDKHFWRGIIDGDGHLGIYLRKMPTGAVRALPLISLTGNLHVCRQFKAFLENTLALSMPNIVSSKKSYSFSVSDHRALRAIKLLYDGCSVALERKLVTAIKIMDSFQTVGNSRYIKRL
jgi:hypothetical protein